MNYVGYVRISTNKSGGFDSNGMESQRQALARYISTSSDGILLKTFEEVESGRVKQRPALLEAIAFAQATKSTILVARLDRLSRAASLVLHLQESKIAFVCCDAPSACSLTIGVMALLAEREAQLISERTKSGMKIAAQRGAKIGNPRLSEARALGCQAIQQRAQTFAGSVRPIINEIMGAGITSYVGISKCLNKRGEKTRMGLPFTPTAVRRILINKTG